MLKLLSIFICVIGIKYINAAPATQLQDINGVAEKLYEPDTSVLRKSQDINYLKKGLKQKGKEEEYEEPNINNEFYYVGFSNSNKKKDDKKKGNEKMKKEQIKLPAEEVINLKDEASLIDINIESTNFGSKDSFKSVENTLPANYVHEIILNEPEKTSESIKDEIEIHGFESKVKSKEVEFMETKSKEASSSKSESFHMSSENLKSEEILNSSSKTSEMSLEDTVETIVSLEKDTGVLESSADISKSTSKIQDEAITSKEVDTESKESLNVSLPDTNTKEHTSTDGHESIPAAVTENTGNNIFFPVSEDESSEIVKIPEENSVSGEDPHSSFEYSDEATPTPEDYVDNAASNENTSPTNNNSSSVLDADIQSEKISIEIINKESMQEDGHEPQFDAINPPDTTNNNKSKSEETFLSNADNTDNEGSSEEYLEYYIFDSNDSLFPDSDSILEETEENIIVNPNPEQIIPEEINIVSEEIDNDVELNDNSNLPDISLNPLQTDESKIVVNKVELQNEVMESNSIVESPKIKINQTQIENIPSVESIEELHEKIQEEEFGYNKFSLESLNKPEKDLSNDIIYFPEDDEEIYDRFEIFNKPLKESVQKSKEENAPNTLTQDISQQEQSLQLEDANSPVDAKPDEINVFLEVKPESEVTQELSLKEETISKENINIVNSKIPGLSIPNMVSKVPTAEKSNEIETTDLQNLIKSESTEQTDVNSNSNWVPIAIISPEDMPQSIPIFPIKNKDSEKQQEEGQNTPISLTLENTETGNINENAEEVNDNITKQKEVLENPETKVPQDQENFAAPGVESVILPELIKPEEKPESTTNKKKVKKFKKKKVKPTGSKNTGLFEDDEPVILNPAFLKPAFAVPVMTKHEYFDYEY